MGFIGTPVALPASVSLCATAMGRQGHVPELGGENLGVPLRPPQSSGIAACSFLPRQHLP